MARSAGLTVFVLSLLLGWPAPCPCAAQPPSPPVPATPRDPAGPVQASALPEPNPAGRARPTAPLTQAVTPDGQPRSTPPTGPPPLVRPLQPAAPSQEANALAKVVALGSAPLEATAVRLPINLATALRLADARPLIVAAAQAGVWVGEAQLQRARVLWIPTLNIGFDYIRHDGGGPD